MTDRERIIAVLKSNQHRWLSTGGVKKRLDTSPSHRRVHHLLRSLADDGRVSHRVGGYDGNSPHPRQEWRWR